MTNNKISVVIPYNKNILGLVYTLTCLQNQTIKPDKIIIIDTSIDKSGFKVTKMFAYNDIKIIIDVERVGIYKAWNSGIDLAGDDNVLIINDDLIFPINFIEVMKYALIQKKSLCYVPKTSTRDHIANFISVSFDYYPSGLISFKPSNWMSGFVFMLTRDCINKVGKFNTKKYDVWFGDDDYQQRIQLFAKQNQITGITLVDGIFVYHFGGRSYRYQSKETLKVIAKDRKNFLGL
jgi:glycosyltransferase involved in cell wall biosynthesis